VYRFRDERGRVLYLGRAVRLRRRVRSYWGDLRDRRHLTRMVPQVARVEALICASDHEACWLERSLLEQTLPRWNRVAGGAEVPLYLALDVSAPAPRLRVLHHPAERFGPTQRVAEPADLYGPFLGGAKVRLLAAALHRLLPLAYTAERLTGAERDLGRIRGVDVDDRHGIVAHCRAILDRRPDAVADFLERLLQRREAAVAQQSYESAGRIQQELQAATWLLAPQRLATHVPDRQPPMELYGWHEGLLLQLSWIDGRVRRWQQRPCSAEAAAARIASTPDGWREFMQRNAELAATLQMPAPTPV
jgi:excinuclease ABC subunit C